MGRDITLHRTSKNTPNSPTALKHFPFVFPTEGIDSSAFYNQAVLP